MGGIGSGRYGGRPTVESAYSLDLDDILHRGARRPGERWGCRSRWTDKRTDALKLNIEIISFPVQPGERPFVEIIHGVGDQDGASYSVDLTSTPQPFGGCRWWFICPISGDPVATLYLPRGATRFASRGAYRLAYASQRASTRDRAILRYHRIRRSLGAQVSPLVPVAKPHRMRWATFERRMRQLDVAEGRSAALSMPLIGALRKRVGLI